MKVKKTILNRNSKGRAISTRTNPPLEKKTEAEQHHMRDKTASSLLKVHKRENFLGFDFEICTFS
jgi:hypothetical protein